MRQISSSRNLNVDHRLLSIRRVSQKPVSAVFARPQKGSTIHGAVDPVVVCTVIGRLDAYAPNTGSRAEHNSTAGLASQARWRFEVPYPTDSAGTTVNCERGDRVTINGAQYRATSAVQADGCLLFMLDRWE